MTSAAAAPARLWSKEGLPQFTGILQFEFRRQLFTLWSFFVFLLAMAPVLLLGARAIVILAGIDDLDSDLHTSFGQLSSLYAVIYRTFFLRLAIFLGCALIFMHLFRGEILEKTLHYYFLCPVRREVLVLGWESMNYLLPPLLKKFSVIYYLESLCPVPIPFKLIALLANPAPAYVSVPGFLILTALILFLAGLRVRKIEITYTQD